MKKIINGKLYNTDTAKLIGTWWNNHSCNDFYYLHKELYLKKTGEFFLYGRGGANTSYAEQCGSHCWCSGERIDPLSVDEAKKFAEKHLSVEEYEAAFGAVEE